MRHHRPTTLESSPDAAAEWSIDAAMAQQAQPLDRTDRTIDKQRQAVEARRHARLQRVARYLQATATYTPTHGERVMDPDSWQALGVIYTALYETGEQQ